MPAAVMSSSPIYDDKYHSDVDVESGYASADSSHASLPDIFFSKPHLKFINQQLANLEPDGEPCPLPLLIPLPQPL